MFTRSCKQCCSMASDLINMFHACFTQQLQYWCFVVFRKLKGREKGTTKYYRKILPLKIKTKWPKLHSAQTMRSRNQRHAVAIV